VLDQVSRSLLDGRGGLRVEGSLDNQHESFI
jgi:hypothetical protein